MVQELKQVAARLRAYRHSRGWTLDELSERAGMSASTLSRLESGKRQVSLELLIPLTRELGIGLDDLVAPVVADPRVRRPEVLRDGIVVAPMSPEGAPFDTYRITYPPSAQMPEQRVHDGYEWLYVLAGKLRLALADQEFVLSAGEAAEFDTRVPHAITAVGPRPAQVLCIVNREGVRLHTRMGPEPEGGDPA